MISSKNFLLLVAGSLPFIALIVAGLSMYFVNRDQIVFNLSDIILPLTGLFLVIFLALYLLLLSFRRFNSVSGIIAGLLVGLSLAVWIQSQLFIWNFGQFNGQRIAWDQWKIKMFIDGSVWIIIIGVSVIVFIKGRQIVKKSLVTLVYFLGLLSVLISVINAPEELENKFSEAEYKDIFTFSPEKNVLIILLDDFQSDYFEYITKNYPREVNDLDGFTFYRNTISRFPTTKTSLPSIMTGTIFRNEKPYYEYIKETHEKFNMIQAYKNKQYTTSFVGQVEGMYPDIISMEKIAYKMNNSYFYPVLEYLEYAAFRALPTVLKPLIFNNGNWCFTELYRKKYPPQEHGADIQFLELFEKHASITSNRKGSFKLLHFFIPHAPWRVNENLQFDPHLSGESGYLDQARGAIRLANRILKKLKKLGIYDQAEIIIMSDHGTGNIQAINHKNIYFDALSFVPPCVQSSSLALLLYKPPNSKGKLITSDIPLELSDLTCLLGLRNDDTACREFNLARSGGKRQRTFYYYEWDHEYWKSDYLPPMTEYIVSGPANDPESYSPGRFIYSSKGTDRIPEPFSSSYTLGKEIIFSTDGKGEADPFIRAGWSPPEEYQRWSDGAFAGLSFHLEKVPNKDLALRLFGFGYLANNKINCQVVTIIVNEVPIGRWLMKNEQWYDAVIPKHLIADKSLNIVFELSNPLSPNEVENSKDIRKLGIAVRKMVIEEIK